MQKRAKRALGPIALWTPKQPKRPLPVTCGREESPISCRYVHAGLLGLIKPFGLFRLFGRYENRSGRLETTISWELQYHGDSSPPEELTHSISGGVSREKRGRGRGRVFEARSVHASWPHPAGRAACGCARRETREGITGRRSKQRITEAQVAGDVCMQHPDTAPCRTGVRGPAKRQGGRSTHEHAAGSHHYIRSIYESG